MHRLLFVDPRDSLRSPHTTENELLFVDDETRFAITDVLKHAHVQRLEQASRPGSALQGSPRWSTALHAAARRAGPPALYWASRCLQNASFQPDASLA